MTQNAGIFDDPFTEGGTLPENLPNEPWGIFRQWWDDAHTGNDGKPVQPNPNAMSVATVGSDGMPASRVVLCKLMDLEAGWICFLTNYEGRKSKQLTDNPKAAAGFHWDSLARQIRVEGDVVRSPAKESDDYFATRPLISRLGAWASKQSRPVESREDLLSCYAEVMERFDVSLDAIMDPEAGKEIVIPRPEFWGGFRIWASRVEFWLGGAGRFHDRAVWTRELAESDDGYVGGDWSATRLAP